MKPGIALIGATGQVSFLLMLKCPTQRQPDKFTLSCQAVCGWRIGVAADRASNAVIRSFFHCIRCNCHVPSVNRMANAGSANKVSQNSGRN